MGNDNLLERNEYIEKLSKQIDAIEEILKLDLGTVVNPEMRKQLESIQDEAKITHRKLVNNEFEIAIVGMEKAGKSTFANALMENSILPTKDSRCTYTSTKIQYSGENDDSAIVSFYTDKEFDTDFKDKLNKLGVPAYNQYSYDNLDETTYRSIYEDLPEEKKQLYENSLNTDILSIIKNYNSFRDLLGRPSITFSGERVNSNDLKEYITSDKLTWAVKQVVIKSSKLKNMQNAIIYDVPGFNSPTELHKAQTLERMKAADAIIVVANGKNPSITGESLKILKESDNEGTKLKSKLFVYANMIELATDIRQNVEDTYKEWIGRGLIDRNKKNRIIAGSALAHLQEAKLESGDRALKTFKEREEELENGDGINTMRTLLEEYNQTDRFDVLMARIDRNISKMNKVLDEISADYEDENVFTTYTPEQTLLIKDIIYDVPDLADKELRDLADVIRHNLPEEKPLTSGIVNYINNNIIIEKYHVTDEEIDTEKKRSLFTGTQKETARIEDRIREAKFREMYQDFSDNVIKISGDLHIQYSEKIIDIIIKAMGINNDSPYLNELKGSLTVELSKFRNDLLPSERLNTAYYQSLIERFTRDVFEILINSQYNEERLRKFYADIDNFFSLSIFYSKSDNDIEDLSYIEIAPKDQPLCMLLLFHHYFDAPAAIQVIKEKICKTTSFFDLPEDIDGYIKKMYLITGGNEKVLEELEKVFSKITDKTDEFKLNILRKTLSRITGKDEMCSVADKKAFTTYYKQFHASLWGDELPSVEDFRKEFNIDIQILQDVLIHACVRAINIEKPFVAREIKSIDDIVCYIHSKEFGSYLTKNFFKIKYKEKQQLDKQKHEREQNAAIISNINSIRATLSE